MLTPKGFVSVEHLVHVTIQMKATQQVIALFVMLYKMITNFY